MLIMSVRTDTVNLIVNVNNNQAQNQLNEQRKKLADIKQEMVGLKKGTQEYIEKSKELKNVTAEMDSLKKQIGIAALSEKELNSELSKLRALRGSVAPFSAEFKDLDKQVKAVESRLYDVRNGVQGLSSVFSKVSDELKQFGVLALGYLGFDFLFTSFKNVVSSSGKLSDALADLQRVAGLTASEAKELNKQLTDIDTRTSSSGLREIAIIAGKLGVAKGDILGFTQAVDQLVVSLGDELGDAGDITDKLGKILNVFDGKISGDNISRLGNAFVELANTGAASGGFIADFDQRLAGIAKSANIGLGELSGLGAGLEELGGRVESSSTAIQKLIISISTDIPKAAKIAGVDVKKFNELFAKDPTEALLLYSQGLVKNKESFSEITESFKDAGEEGARTIETITKLGNSADYLRGRIDLGKQSLKENSAITDAFALKNETLGAQIDKLGKAFASLTSSNFVTGFVSSIITGLTSLITIFDNTNNALNEFKKQAESVKALENNIVPLINRIDELSTQSKLSKDEQVELNKAIQTIGATIPIAVTEFDKYGKAIGISTTKAREFIDLQKLILKEKNRGAINEQQNTQASVEAELKAAQQQLASLQKAAAKTAAVYDQLYGPNGSLSSKGVSPSNNIIKEINFYNRSIGELTNRVNTAQARLQGIKGIITELNGENLKVPEIATPTNNTNTVTATAGSAQKITKTKPVIDNSEFERLQQEAIKFQDDLLKLKQRNQIKGEEPEQAEIDAAKAKYQALTDQLKNYYVKKAITSDEYFKSEKIIEEERKKALYEIMYKYVQQSNQKAEELRGQADEGKEKQRLKDLDDAAKAAEAAGKEDLARAQRLVINTAPGTDARLKANEALLKLQFEQDVAHIKEKNEYYLLKEAELQDSIAKLRAEKNAADIDRIFEYVGYFQSALDSINQIITQSENRQLAKDKAANDAKKKNFKEQLDNKLISKGVYDKKTTALDEEQDKKERALRRKQAEREKALNLFTAFINNAQAIIKTMSSVPFPANIPLAIAQGIAGGLQIAAISNAPLPELGTGDWIRKGDKHSDPSGGILAKIERDEAVMAARAMTNPDVISVTGTTAQITSALNSRAGGASWAGGAVIQMPAWRTQMPVAINPNLPRIMEQGGIVRPISGNTDAILAAGISNDILMQLLQETKANTNAIQTMKTNLKAIVSLKEFKQVELELDAAKKASSF